MTLYLDYSTIVDAGQQLDIVENVNLDTGEVGIVGVARAGDERAYAANKSLGLSTGHICTWLDGGMVQVKLNRPAVRGVKITKRGRITGFSRKSRCRLMRKVAATRKSQMPVFVTLTYPAEYPDDATVWKRHLRAFWMRIIRRFPSAGAIWKLEFQRRGAPHYHLLIWGVDYVQLLLVVSRLWYEVVKSGDPKHLAAGTRVERIRSWRGVMSYASKYLGKVDEVLTEYPGRIWGVVGTIPWADMVSVQVTARQAYQVIRLLRRLMHARPRAYYSLTAFADGTFWFERLDRLLEL